MADYVASLKYTLDDQVSAGAQAATDSLTKLADAADKASGSTEDLTKTTSRVGPSYDTINKRIDENANLTAAMETINRKYQQGLAAVRAELDAGGISAAQATEKEARLGTIRDISTTNATKQSRALAQQFGAQASAATGSNAAAQSMSTAHERVTEATGHASHASAGFTRELIVMGHEITQGNFSRLGGSMLVLTERSATLSNMVAKIASGLMGWPGLALLVTAALGAILAHATTLEDEQHQLQTAIDGTGRSASISAAQLEVYATKLNRTSELSKSAAVSLTGKLSRNVNLSSDQIGDITTQAPDVGVKMGTDTVAAAKLLEEAYSGSYDAIKKLDEAMNFLTVDERTQIYTLFALGQREQALQIVHDELAAHIKDAREKSLTPTQKAAEELGNAWNNMMDAFAKSDIMQAVIKRNELALEGWGRIFRDLTPAPLEAQIVTLNASALRLTDTIAEFNRRGIPVPSELTNSLAATNILMDTLIEKSKTLADGVPAVAPSGKMGSAGLSEAQQKEVNDLTRAYDNQVTVMHTAVTARAALQAAQNAEIQIVKLGLVDLAAHEYKQKAVNAAIAEASDGAIQNASAMGRQTEYLNRLSAATEQNRAAVFLATAQTQAHEKAVTTTGASEAGLTREILAQAVAQEKLKTSQSILGFSDQATQLSNIIGATSELEAHNDALENTVIALTREYRAAAEASKDPKVIADMEHKINLTRDYVNLIDQQNIQIAAEKNLRQGAQTLEYLQAEVSTLGMSEDSRARILAQLKEQQSIEANQPGLIKATRDAEIAQAGAIADATANLQHQQAAMSELGSFASQAFDQLGQAISNAFVSGQAAAVNWGNIVRAIVASLIQEIAKLAILTPIINSLTGQNGVTLGSVVNAIGGNSMSSSTGSSSMSSLLSMGSSASSLSGAFGGPTIGSSLGLTGPSGIMSGFAPMSYLTNAGGTGLLNMGVMGSTTMAGTNTAIASMGGGLYGPALPSAAGAASGVSTVGMFASGIGGGFALGSLAGMGVQSLTNKTGPAPEIGAAGGAIAGAIIGSVVPVIGTVIGGIIGGVIGGGSAGFIGPAPQHAFSTTGVTTDGSGQLVLGRTLSQKVNTTAEVQQLQAEVASLNQALASAGITASTTGRVQIGQNTPGGYVDPTKFGSLDAALGSFKFSASNDNNLNSKLAQQNFGSVAQFTSWVTAYQAAQAATAQYLTQTTTLMNSFGKSTGSLNDAIASINSQFDASIASAELLKNSGFLSTDQINQLITAETQLNGVRATAIQQANDAATAQTNQSDLNFRSQQLSAEATISGMPADAQAAQLFAFDANATQTRTQFAAQLVATYGDAYKTQQGYADQMAIEEASLGAQRLAIQVTYNKQIAANDNAATAIGVNLQSRFLSAKASISGSPQDAETAQLFAFDSSLQPQRDALSQQLQTIYGSAYSSSSDYAQKMLDEERTFGEERLAIVQSYNDKATQTASATIISLSDYLIKLQTGSNSPLNSLDQLKLAENSFDALAKKAKAGDFSALGQISGSADILLNASRAVNGSGTGYVADFNKVLDALSSLTTATPDTLTASVFAVQTQTQTQVLSDALAAVKAEIIALRLQVQQGNNTPAQIAA